MTEIELVHSENVDSLFLGDFVMLHEMPVRGASVVARRIDEANLQSMMYAEWMFIPPITVASTTRGFVIVDGHHRHQRAVNLAFREYLLAQGKWPKDESDQPFPPDLAIYRELLEVDGKLRAYNDEERKYILDTRVAVKVVNFNNFFELLRYAWSANSSHGLSHKEGARGRYGLWLYQEARKNGIPMTYEQAAREAGCQKPAILNFARRHAGDESLTEGEHPVVAKPAPTQEEQLQASCKSLAAQIKKLPRVDSNLVIVLSEVFKASDNELVSGVGKALVETGALLKAEWQMQKEAALEQLELDEVAGNPVQENE